MSDVTLKDMGMNEIKRELMRLDGSYVQVGFYGNASHKRGNGKTIAEIAFRNEYGDANNKWRGKSAPIPSRPFMRQAFEKNVGKLKRNQKSYLKQVVAGNLSARDGLNALGATHEGDIKREIKSGGFEPNAPLTVALKTVRGKRGTTPLIDTGQMRQSVAHKVRMRGN